MANTDSNGKDAVRQVFVGALDRPTAEREAWVRAACRGDEALRQRVARLLRSHRRAADRDFLVAEAPTSDPDEGRSIGPYHLVRLLGEGGFGRVYLAAQREPIVRDVAVKLVKPGMDGKHVLARFDAERQALALMDHVNIARILDAGATAESRPFFVMEYVDGLPITDYCDGRTLQIRERLEIFVQVCLAVHHAHQKGVIHRDLKPSNLLVAESDAGPVPKIIDFGIAKALAVPLTAHTLHTGEQQLLGTPAYMSPEQARVAGDQSDIDTRSDIYSLGAVLYKLLTGTTPLSAADVAAHGHDLQRAIRATRTTLPSQRALAAASDDDRVAFDRRADPGELARLLRGDLDWIALKALEHDRQRRYDSATALADDVRRHLDHEPVLARRPGAGYLLWKFVRRHQVVASSIAFAALALVVGLVLALHGLLEAGRQAELVRTQLREVHLSQARAHRAGDAPGRRQASLAAIAAASAIARSDDLRDEVIACLGLTDVLPLRSFADCGAIYGDGSRAHTRLAQWQPGAGIAVLASETGDRLTTLPLTADPRAVSFSADGSRLAAVTEDRRVTVFDVDTQRIVFERAGIEPSPHAIAFDRGAVPPRWLALTSGEGSVRTFGLDNGSELAVLPVGEGKVALASSPLGDR
ncbi:MAG: protein kinase, partial [Planctomycetes bacterium]|nr:protein kinase [Planctomycetota bacterium]